MKKIGSIFITIVILAVAILNSYVIANANSENVYVAEDFEGFVSSDKPFTVPPANESYDGPDFCETKITTENPLMGDKSVAFKLTKNIKKAALVASTEAIINPPDAGYEGIAMRIKINKQGGGFPEIRFSIYNGSFYLTLGQDYIILNSKGANKTRGFFGGSAFPSDFEGVIFLPIKSFPKGYPMANPNFSIDEIKNKFILSLMFIQYTGAGWVSGDSIEIDNISFYKGNDTRQIATDMGLELPELDKTPFLDDTTKVKIETFNKTALPIETILYADKMQISEIEELAVLKSDSKARIHTLYNTYFSDITGGKKEEINLKDTALMSFPSPKFVDPKLVKVYIVNPDTTSTLVPIDNITDGYLNCYIRSKAIYAVTVPGDARYAKLPEGTEDDTPETPVESPDIDTIIPDIIIDRPTPAPEEISNLLIDNDVLKSIENATDELVTIKCRNGSILTIAQQELLKSTGKNVDIYVYDEKSELLAIWKFDPLVTASLDLDLTLEASTNNLDKITELVKNQNKQILTFKHHGQLPSQCKIVVPNKSKFTIKQLITVYYYNQDKNLLENTDAKLALTKNEEYLVLTTKHCSEYVITTFGATKGKKITTFVNSNFIVILIISLSILALIAAIAILTIIIKKKGVIKK